MHEAVPAELLEDYQEALLTLQDSPKASAALSRRCLQHLLVLKGAKQKELIDQIAELQPSFPSHVQGHIDFVRQLGNLSAHPKQSRSTGEIVDVEPGEAEWMIELLEELFDHYYAKPAEAKKRADALKAKYADAGKVTPSPFGP